MAGTQFSKECTGCHQQIVMQKQGDTWHALNKDFTPHVCAKGSKAQTSPALTIIGRITEYEGTNVHISGKCLFLQPERRKSAQEKYPVGTVVKAAHEKGTCNGMENATGYDLEKFLKDEQAQQTLPATSTAPTTPPAAAEEKPKETCTSPKTTPPFVAPAERKKIDRDLLLSMVNNPDTYWKAKTLMDIEAHESICRQVEIKNWQEAVSLAIAYQQARPVEGEAVFESATKIHDFIQIKVKAVSG